ncbi:unnamed protein product [Soboliphyme baturini]|uniref:PDZ domain-containing protein n=1 Tax=Soboliphyme baturini TaxID=241478 RepID=A0A183IUF2_9BILA|nr:unnamed protein product [Soboliphyme baturini]
MPPLPADAPRPRECHIIKTYPEQEYGFNLHAEIGKRQYIGSVDPESPAETAGLKPGDRILAVNGMSIKQEPHKQVVAKIKEDPLQCYLTVIDDEGMNWYTERKLSVPTDMSVFAQMTDADEHSEREAVRTPFFK